MEIDYITSERFIHDSLIVRATEGVSSLYDSWKEKGSIESFLLTWPAEEVRAHDGNVVNDVCRLELPEDRTRWNKLIMKAVQITKAYAFLLVEQREKDIRAILESHHGTRCWIIPIEDHAGLKILGRVTHRDDLESVGLLWRPTIAQA
jgi:hypothetical protein